jgi:segregation and condensation protein B
MTDKIIEAVLFASDAPVDERRLRDIAGGLSAAGLYVAVDDLNRQYEQSGRTFRIMEVAGGYQFESLPAWGPYIEQLFTARSRPRLSRAALETLAIIAYKQPITKAEMDALRGVDSDGPLRTLQNRELIEVAGRAETVGKPLLYGTTKEFLRFFGLMDIKDLPGADELASMFDGTEPVETSPDQLSLTEGMGIDTAPAEDAADASESADAADADETAGGDESAGVDDAADGESQ